MKKSILCLAGLFANLALLMAQPPVGKGYELIFEDNFEGNKLNEKMWFYREGRRTGGGYMDGLNLRENVEVKNGKLYVHVRHEQINGKWENTGGGVQTYKNFGYGYFETLSKPFMDGKGVHTSFWQAGSRRGNNHVFEIDSYEIDSKSWMGCNNLYYQLKPDSPLARWVPWPYRCHVPFSVDPNGFFLDAFEVTPDGIHYYDNGKEVAYCEWKELNAQQMIWLTALNGCGKVDTTALPGASEFEYFRYYAKDYPGITILPNGNFEYNQGNKLNTPICWVVKKEDEPNVLLVEGNAPRDRYFLQLGGAKPYRVSVEQPVEMIRNGEYTLRAKVKCAKGSSFELIAEGKGGVFRKTFTGNKWSDVLIPNVRVEGNEVLIRLFAQGEAGQLVEVDDVEFFKPMPKGQKRPVSEPFAIRLDPIWQLAMQKPERFVGDQRFFFFDRMVGLGDAITVKFTVTADEVSNMTPISRMPKTGNSGWSVQLSDRGDMIFRIGSMANNTAVMAKNAYQAGKPCAVTCVFDKGKASIYINGKLSVTQDNIPQRTDETATAGRLGTTGASYEAVSDVIVDTGEKAKESRTMRNFRGEIEKLQIYNRVKID